MERLTATQINILAEKLYELGNLTVISLIVTPLIAPDYNLFIAILGVIMGSVLYFIAYTLMKKRKAWTN